MKNCIKKIGYFLLLTICTIQSYSQDLDSVLHIPKNAFFKNIVENKELITSVANFTDGNFIEINNPILKNKYILFIKNKQGFFAHFDGTSRIYQYSQETDSTYILQRKDKVENINYNINAFFFSHNNTLYNYGGYGFWKSNGLLRKFNQLNKEWDIVPLNKEIDCKSEFGGMWKNPKDNFVYILYKQLVNEGIRTNDKNANSPEPESYSLDLSTFTVEKRGKLNDVLIPAFIHSNALYTDDGILLVKIPNSYYLKPQENKLYALDDVSMIQTLGRLGWECLIYYNKGKFHFWNVSKNHIDSIDISNIKIKPIGKIWTTDWKDYYAVGAGIIILVVGLSIFFFRRKKNTKATDSKVERAALVAVPILSETEISLIKLLIDKSEQTEYASSNEINYIIGCKDKNVGLQKKMRSDIINSINTKYKAFSKTNQSLIESKRTDFDKRYFHYHIMEEQLERAKVFIDITGIES